jgi:hypothetical protein
MYISAQKKKKKLLLDIIQNSISINFMKFFSLYPFGDLKERSLKLKYFM